MAPAKPAKKPAAFLSAILGLLFRSNRFGSLERLKPSHSEVVMSYSKTDDKNPRYNDTGGQTISYTSQEAGTRDIVGISKMWRTHGWLRFTDRATVSSKNNDDNIAFEQPKLSKFNQGTEPSRPPAAC